MSRMYPRVRSLAVVGFLAAVSLSLTACNSGDSNAGSGSDSRKDSSASAASKDSGGGNDSSASAVPKDSGGKDPSASAVPKDSGGKDPRAKPQVISGNLTYLAPGKLEVGDRAFFVAGDTKIQGGDICGDPETPEAESCTADDLEQAAKDGNLTVDVTIKKGIAERVVQS